MENEAIQPCPTTGRAIGDHGSAVDAIAFALDSGRHDHDPANALAFLDAWNEGNAFEEWPEFYEWLASCEATRPIDEAIQPDLVELRHIAKMLRKSIFDLQCSRMTKENLDALDAAIAATRPDLNTVKADDIVREAAAPWADYHGDIPEYDHPLRPVFESGVQYTVELLAKMLKVENYDVCDGTEEFDGDLGGTLINIVAETYPKDEHGDWIDLRDPQNRGDLNTVKLNDCSGSDWIKGLGVPWVSGLARTDGPPLPTGAVNLETGERQMFDAIRFRWVPSGAVQPDELATLRQQHAAALASTAGGEG